MNCDLFIAYKILTASDTWVSSGVTERTFIKKLNFKGFDFQRQKQENNYKKW